MLFRVDFSRFEFYNENTCFDVLGLRQFLLKLA